MKLYYASSSAYVRKVLIAAHELGVADRIEPVVVPAPPLLEPNIAAAFNPLGKVPALLTDDGDAIYDSVVICEYMDLMAPAENRLFPNDSRRIPTLVLHALGHGMIDAAIAARGESVTRPEQFRWAANAEYQMDKVRRGLEQIEARVGSFDAGFCIGKIAIACALGYLDFRFSELAWRRQYPLTGQWFEPIALRPSMRATMLA